MVKINVKEIQGTIYESKSIRRQAHFLNFESLLKNILRFFEKYSEKYGNIEFKVRNINKMMLDEININLKNRKISVENSTNFDVKSNFRAFLKINDPNSFYYTLKAVDRRMVVKVNRFEPKKKAKLFILSQEDSTTSEKHYFDDFSNFISRECNNLKTITYKDDGFKGNLKVWNEFKPNEWTNAFEKVNIGKKNGMISTSLSFVTRLESLKAKKKFDMDNIKEFVIDSGITDSEIPKKDVNSLVLLPVGTIVGTTIKAGLTMLSHEDKLNEKNKTFKYKENNFQVRDSKNIFNSIGITINRVFW
ncbi:hypothetical protein NNC19_07975 [Clostridium sp. SHJSY1]|uniref:hypothetical protein n=1 Tax=Clostridium sp. SHJSY1 TaxID=2942483 RepID=UPI0028748C91|nr:hypothetical protein [Clostridium sp. SHJSY1]MDS0525611.1 hypothetical protein [Clostridium sp. SHJSY1]